MKIIQTPIPDVTEDNLDEAKMELSNNIIKNLYPLFDEVIDSKMKGTDSLEKELKEVRSVVLQKKNEIQGLLDELTRHQKVSKLLHRLEKLIAAGLLFDGSLKHETIVLLKVIDTLDNKRLDHHLDVSLQIISKRFAHS